MKLKIKITYDSVLFFCGIILLAFQFLPIVMGYVGALPSIPFLGVGLLIIFINMGHTSETTLTLLLLTVFMFATEMMRIQQDGIIIGIYKILLNIFIVLCPLYYIQKKKSEYLRKLFWLTLSFIMITEATSIIGLIQYPEAARSLISTAEGEEVYIYMRKNIGGYDISYMLSGLNVIMFIMKKNRLVSKKLYYCFIALSVLFLVSAQFTMALLLFAISIGVLLMTINNPKRIFFSCIICIAVFLVSLYVLPDILVMLAKYVPGSDLKIRLLEVSQVLSGVDVISMHALSSRIAVYEQSIKVLKEYFIVGNVFFGESLGGHSYILDFLAQYGLFGCGLLIVTLKRIYTMFGRDLKKLGIWQSIAFTQMMYLLAQIVNPLTSAAFFWGMFAMTGMACVMIREENALLTDQNSKEN